MMSLPMNKNTNHAGMTAMIILFAIMAFCMVWIAFNAQTIANEALIRALDTIDGMEVISETTMQTVEGDSAVINNAEFEQYNDNATRGVGE